MNTQLSTKLAALAAALMLNSAMFGGVAYLFNGQLHHNISASLVRGSVAVAVAPTV